MIHIRNNGKQDWEDREFSLRFQSVEDAMPNLCLPHSEWACSLGGADPTDFNHQRLWLSKAKTKKNDSKQPFSNQTHTIRTNVFSVVEIQSEAVLSTKVKQD